MKDELVLIDGNYWLFSSYYATASMGNLMMNKDGIPTNAVFGFITRLENIIKKNPKGIMVAFDAKGKTFRSELLEDYKGTRKETPEELKCQFPIIREFLDAYSIPYLELEGYEGDDIIGTVATYASKEGYQVNIMTGDKDMMQLVDDTVHVYKRNTKTKSDDIITKEVFFDKYGLEPDQMRDLLGLMGDTSDNIPGIPGIGEKTALKLLHQYKTIENLKEHSSEIKGKMGEKIRDNIELGLKSKEIATILRDIPMDISLCDYEYKGYNFESVKDFYLKYDMNSLLKKLSLQNKEEKKEELSYQIVKSLPDINKPSAIMGAIYDTNYHKSIILGYGIYNEDGAYYISYEDACADSSFLSYMKDESLEKYTYNIKSQLLAAYWNQLDIKGMTFDLQLASYILNPSLKDEMKYICDYYDYYGLSYDEEIFGKLTKKHIPELDVLAKHTVSKAKAVYDLKGVVEKKLMDENQYDLYKDIELPVTYILADMERQGAKVDVNVLKVMEKEFEERIGHIEQAIYKLAGKEFNVASVKQLGEVLFVDLGLPNGKKTKTGYSTSAEILENLEDEHEIIPYILQYRLLTKLLSTYVKGLQDQVFADSKIHTIYNQALTQTGRLSSVEPNLQNIPIRQEEGKLIRKAFVPEFDYLVSFDYSQIELRILAHMGKVKNLIEAFNHNKDIHTHTAALVYGISDEEVTPLMRRQAKAVNFGIIYGMSEFRLSKQIGVSLKEAKTFIERYFEEYPEIKDYMNDIVEKCKEDGYVSTLLNRKRYIPTINDRNFMVREQAKRFAMNSPIQGSGADILKVAMIKVDRIMKEKKVKSKMILQVHDELVFDVYKDELELMMDIISKAMEEAVSMEVPLKVEGSYASNWYDLK